MKMPKMKTHRAGAKRFKVSATGKLMRNQAGRSHINTKKTSSRKRRLDRVVGVHSGDAIKIALQLPYATIKR
jgi:large subunit ribosomal protein L35